MDWQHEIDQFQPLQPDEVEMFAPPREMEQAIATYNRAISNLHNDSADIALIALRKLVTTYPMFTQASFLLGCSQVQLGQLADAREHLHHAMLVGLQDQEQQRAETCLAEADRLLSLQSSLDQQDQRAPDVKRQGRILSRIAADKERTAGSHVLQSAIPAAAILQRSHRADRVRVASDKERREVIRRGEFHEEEKTFVREQHEPVEILRKIVPVAAALLVIGLLVFLGIRFLPGLLRSDANKPDDAQKLTWLMTRLDELSADDNQVAALLEDYEAWVQPSPTPTLTPEPSETQAAPTGPAAEVTTATPGNTTALETTSVTTTETATPAVQNLAAAGTLYQQADSLKSSDVVAAADALLQAETLLTDIPDDTTAAGVEGNAAGLRQQVTALIGSIGATAAERLRVTGMTFFDQQQYAEALTYFEKGYQLYPKTYGGGLAYYCGRCNQLLGNKEAAKPYFDFVIANFAGRDIARSAASRLTEMGYTG